MTDERWEQLRRHVERYSVPPCALFPTGWGLDVVVVEGEGLVELEPSQVLVSRDEYEDLQRRAAEAPPRLGRPLPR